MLVDLHAHSSEISKCCLLDIRGVLNEAKNLNIDGIVLTNHYRSSYVTNGDEIKFAKEYVQAYYNAVEVSKEMGVKLFFGIEVTNEKQPYLHYLIYGVDTDFPIKNPTLYSMSQQQLYETVKEAGGILIQAHPFRYFQKVQDIRYLDGVEISCHPLYGNSYSNELYNIAKENNLALTCGGDYHADTYRPYCGMYLPSDTKNTHDIAKYIIDSKKVRLCIQEPNCQTYFDLEYERKGK